MILLTTITAGSRIISRMLREHLVQTCMPIVEIIPLHTVI